MGTNISIFVELYIERERAILYTFYSTNVQPFITFHVMLQFSAMHNE